MILTLLPGGTLQVGGQLALPWQGAAGAGLAALADLQLARGREAQGGLQVDASSEKRGDQQQSQGHQGKPPRGRGGTGGWRRRRRCDWPPPPGKSLRLALKRLHLSEAG